MLFSASSSLMSPPPLLFSLFLISRSVTLAAKVNTPDRYARSSIDAIRWALALLSISLVCLPLFLLALLLLKLLRNSNNFGTVKEGPSHTITQYPAPPLPSSVCDSVRMTCQPNVNGRSTQALASFSRSEERTCSSKKEM